MEGEARRLADDEKRIVARFCSAYIDKHFRTKDRGGGAAGGAAAGGGGAAARAKELKEFLLANVPGESALRLDVADDYPVRVVYHAMRTRHAEMTVNRIATVLSQITPDELREQLAEGDEGDEGDVILKFVESKIAENCEYESPDIRLLRGCPAAMKDLALESLPVASREITEASIAMHELKRVDNPDTAAQRLARKEAREEWASLETSAREILESAKIPVYSFRSRALGPLILEKKATHKFVKLSPDELHSRLLPRVLPRRVEDWDYEEIMRVLMDVWSRREGVARESLEITRPKVRVLRAARSAASKSAAAPDDASDEAGDDAGDEAGDEGDAGDEAGDDEAGDDEDADE